MKVFGNGQCSLTFDVADRYRWLPHMKEILSGQKRVTLTVECTAVTSEPGGRLKLNAPGVLSVEEFKDKRSIDQNSTLRGIERFIAWCFLDEVNAARGPNDQDVEDVHEYLLAQYAPRHLSIRTGIPTPVRTSSMNKAQMSDFIDAALSELVQLDVPTNVVSAVGQDVEALFKEWYSWRSGWAGQNYPKTWPEYKAKYPYCEFCFQPGEYDRMHIISGGADGTIYEEPWNWFHAKREYHSMQHQEGWESIFRKFPHVKNKVLLARKLAEKEGGLSAEDKLRFS